MQAQLLPIFPDGSIGFRHQRRLAVRLAVEAELGQERHLARLIELSARGARLQLALMLRPGDAVKLRRNGVTVCGTVSWADGATAGIRFVEQMSEEVFLRLRRATPPTIPV